MTCMVDTITRKSGPWCALLGGYFVLVGCMAKTSNPSDQDDSHDCI